MVSRRRAKRYHTNYGRSSNPNSQQITSWQYPSASGVKLLSMWKLSMKLWCSALSTLPSKKVCFKKTINSGARIGTRMSLRSSTAESDCFKDPRQKAKENPLTCRRTSMPTMSIALSSKAIRRSSPRKAHSPTQLKISGAWYQSRMLLWLCQPVVWRRKEEPNVISSGLNQMMAFYKLKPNQTNSFLS